MRRECGNTEKEGGELVTVEGTKSGCGLARWVACDLIGVHVALQIDGSAARVGGPSAC